MIALELMRFALYADLGILFGAPATAALIGDHATLNGARRLFLVGTFAALLFTVIATLILVAAMTATRIREIDWPITRALLFGTALGWSLLIRLGAVAAAVLVSALSRPHPRWLALLCGIAIATLAWSGHAAASEGTIGFFRLANDVVHMLVAALWIGALVLFLGMLTDRRMEPVSVGLVLARFSSVGSVIIAILMVTGAFNVLFLSSSPEHWAANLSQLVVYPYGRLLLLKLGLFVTMLVFAATNRFWLVPWLVQTLERDKAGRAAGWLMASIATELAVGMTILWIVARLGTLDPGFS